MANGWKDGIPNGRPGGLARLGLDSSVGFLDLLLPLEPVLVFWLGCMRTVGQTFASACKVGLIFVFGSSNVI